MLPTDIIGQHVEMFTKRHFPKPTHSHGILYKQVQVTLNIKEPSLAMEDLLNIPMVCLFLLISHKRTLFPSNYSFLKK